MRHEPLIRRDKRNPNADMAHSLKVGITVFVLFVLPVLLVAQWQLMPTAQEQYRTWLQERQATIEERTLQ